MRKLKKLILKIKQILISENNKKGWKILSLLILLIIAFFFVRFSIKEISVTKNFGNQTHNFLRFEIIINLEECEHKFSTFT
jgi:hypothetical protein